MALNQVPSSLYFPLFSSREAPAFLAFPWCLSHLVKPYQEGALVQTPPLKFVISPSFSWFDSTSWHCKKSRPTRPFQLASSHPHHTHSASLASLIMQDEGEASKPVLLFSLYYWTKEDEQNWFFLRSSSAQSGSGQVGFFFASQLVSKLT